VARKHSSAALVDVIDRARALVTAETVPELPPDADAAGYALATYWMHPGASMLFDVLASYGAPLAHAAVLYAHGLKATKHQGNYSIQYFAREPRDGSIYSRELRCAVLGADDASRASCVAAATERFGPADFWLKVTLAVAHPSRPEWAAEVGRAILGNTAMRSPPITSVFMSLRDIDLVRPLLARRASFNPLVDLVETFGDGALPILLERLESPHDRYDLKHAAVALSAFESGDVARAMAKHLGKKEVRGTAIPYYLRFPALAKTALEDAALGRNKNAKLAAQILEQVGRAVSAERAIDIAPLDEATAEELPWILTLPPWVKKKRARRTSVEPLALALLERRERVVLPLEEEQRILQFVQGHGREGVPPMSPEEAATWQQQLEKGEAVGLWAHNGKLVPDDLAEIAFNEGRANVTSNRELDPWIALARLRERGIPGLVRFLEERFAGSGPRYWMTAIHGVDSHRVAAALLAHTDGRHAKLAWQWIRDHVDATLVALVPAALGSGAHADLAAVKLRLLASSGDQERILAVASEYGAEALAAATAILGRDPRLDCPPRPPKMPSTWRPETLHRPRLKSGRALPLSALEPIGHMLKFSALEAPYAGLADVVEACEPRSLAEFSWSLARTWELAGAKRKDLWMLHSLAHFADDEVTRRTTPAIRDDNILGVLGTIATDAAAMELATIMARRSSHYGASPAEEQFERIAKKRGVTKDELEDRITPTAGLDPNGGAILDYGSRSLAVGFDARLEPYVVSESGEHVKQLPPKRKSDDKAKVAAAQERWRDLKEDVATIAERRVRAVERAMTVGRSWSKEEFLAYWVNHPLLFHMAQGIVWGVRVNGAITASFRVAEDRTFAGEADDAVDVPTGARVVVPHRLELGEAAERWSHVLVDYRVVPPLDQLTRAVYLLAPAEADAVTIERKLSAPFAYNLLDQALWRAGFVDRPWQANQRSRGLALGRTPDAEAIVTYVYNVAQIESVTIRFQRRDGASLLPKDVHPVEVSETIRSLVVSTTPAQ
jgi:hypothetical protein